MINNKSNKNVYSLLGASNHCEHQRQPYDLYCTHPLAVEELLKLEDFSNNIYEPCDGLGHISNVLISHGYNVKRSDIITRGRDIECVDFLSLDKLEDSYDIITNPPYSNAIDFVCRAIELVGDGRKVAMWLRILFLESQARKELFTQYPPKIVWISSKRIECGMNGNFSGRSAQAYAWFVWVKNYKGTTQVNWF